MNRRIVLALGAVVVSAGVSTAAASPDHLSTPPRSEAWIGGAVGQIAVIGHRKQVLVFIADATQARTSGPSATHIGHRQIASGVVQDANGNRLGRFSFTCTWVKIIGPDAQERCAAQGTTPDGRIAFSGPARESAQVHTWRISGGTGRYTNAHGTTTVRDLSTTESLLTVTVTPQPTITLHSGVVPRPASDRVFVRYANRVCAAAARHVHALPGFPLSNFDPEHPAPAALRTIGAYFTGPGDPRSTLTALDKTLNGLGDPPASRSTWRRLLMARARTLAVINQQDRAALAGNVPAFVKTLSENTGAYTAVAINSAVFGATACAF